MPLIKTSNPALSSGTYTGVNTAYGAEPMTMTGTVNRTGILLVLCVLTAAYTWNQFFTTRTPASISGELLIGFLGGFVVALVTVFKKEWAPVTAPLYALLEGLALGGISAIFDLRYPGIAIEAVSLTFATLVVMLLAYRSGLIRPTRRFMVGVVAATGGIALFYVAEMILGGFFHIYFNAINGSGPIGIGFSLFVVAIAALNLVLDFGFVEQGVAAGAPKYMEWYSAFGILVTLVWLYLEMLRLLAKLSQNR